MKITRCDDDILEISDNIFMTVAGLMAAAILGIWVALLSGPPTLLSPEWSMIYLVKLHLGAILLLGSILLIPTIPSAIVDRHARFHRSENTIAIRERAAFRSFVFEIPLDAVIAAKVDTSDVAGKPQSGLFLVIKREAIIGKTEINIPGLPSIDLADIFEEETTEVPLSFSKKKADALALASDAINNWITSAGSARSEA